MALERLKIATKIWGRNGGTLASPSLVHEPVLKYKLQMEDEESWSQTSSNLRVNIMLEPCLRAFILMAHPTQCFRYSVFISAEGTHKGQGATKLSPGLHPIHREVSLLVPEPLGVSRGQVPIGRLTTEVIDFGL
jgi:hypothetical protein